MGKTCFDLVKKTIFLIYSFFYVSFLLHQPVTSCSFKNFYCLFPIVYFAFKAASLAARSDAGSAVGKPPPPPPPPSPPCGGRGAPPELGGAAAAGAAAAGAGAPTAEPSGTAAARAKEGMVSATLAGLTTQAKHILAAGTYFWQQQLAQRSH